MNLFNLLTIGQNVKVVIYGDEVNEVPTHYKTIGTIIGVANDFYKVDFGGITELIDWAKLEAIM